MIVGLDDLLLHLRIDAGDEDRLLEIFALAAEKQVSSWIDRPVYATAAEMPLPSAAGYSPNQIVADEAIKAAILMMGARFYVNREGAGDGTEDASLPMSVRAILAPYRVFHTPDRSPHENP